MQNPISAADATPVRVVLVTMDTHLASAIHRARATLESEIPGLSLTTHAATEWSVDPQAVERCRADIARGDIIVSTMLFMEDHFKPVLPALIARRDICDAMVCAMSAQEVIRLTCMGRFRMDGATRGPLALLKRLSGAKGKLGSAGANQMKMLRKLPKLLRFIPGTAQDLRAYLLTLQYFLSGSEENMANMVRFLVDRYAVGPRRALRGTLKVLPPAAYPEVGIYHPRMPGRIAEKIDRLPAPAGGDHDTVGLLIMRSYVLAGNTGHYDGVIAAFEAHGLRVIPAFATGLDARPAIENFFFENGRPAIDVMVSLMGFSLVGGPAYNDAKAAENILARLDVPYIAAHPVEFQTVEQWQSSDRGLLPVESTIMVAIPELEGSTGPIVFGGRSDNGGILDAHSQTGAFTTSKASGDMRVCGERADALAARVEKLAALRGVDRASRKIAIVLFNFPPNAGNTGTAAYLSVFESLHQTLIAMKHAGYSVDLPESVDDLRKKIIEGNAPLFGAAANVHTRVSTDAHVRRERWLAEIEAQWGPAPGRQQSDGSSIFVLGERFGNVFVGIQPALGYEGDPMRLLFEKGFSPTHAFSAFYRWLREDFNAHAVLHFGTHGALEFMPGKQAGMSGSCWPDRLIGDLPNFYLYASNNPSEGAIAKRRAAATLISYLTPPVANADLYRGLVDLKASLDRWRQLEPEATLERSKLAALIQAQAADLDLGDSEPAWGPTTADQIGKLAAKLFELEYTLIPHGLHIVGKASSIEERVDMLLAMAEAGHDTQLERASVEVLVRTSSAEKAMAGMGVPRGDEKRDKLLAIFRELIETDKVLSEDHETRSILRALDGHFIRPAPGGDLLRTPSVLPTGRNLHGFDPFRIPSAYAVQDGARQAARLIERHMADGNPFPETVAIVLWGTDNLKTEGGPIAQVLALMGARPRFDNYGRLAGTILIPLEKLGHPRIDVMVSLSGIFRDLMPLQIGLLAEAAFLAASADEPTERNYVRKHALAFQAANECDIETSALRLFGNADGAYGANVNHFVENSRWDDADELAETYVRRKGFAYGRKGPPKQQPELLNSVLAAVDLAYQNLDSVELGLTTVDTYFDTLGGVSSAVRRAKGASAPIYIGDQTRGPGTVRTLSEQIALETRTRTLNPKWFEGMLRHGYEGVRQIETHLTNTMGWSATTGQVAPWVYQKLTQTFVLDAKMRERLAELNPTATAKITNRLIEAHERCFWSADDGTLEALRRADEELEDRLEGVGLEVAA